MIAGYREEDGVGGFAVAHDGTVCLDNDIVAGAVGCYYALLAPGVKLQRGRIGVSGEDEEVFFFKAKRGGEGGKGGGVREGRRVDYDLGRERE